MSLSPLAANVYAVALASDGCVRIVPRRETVTWDALTDKERLGLIALAEDVRTQLGGERFTVGFDTDAQPPAVLVIPRRHAGGGVASLLLHEPALTTGPDQPLLRAIRPLIRQARTVDVVAAFVQDGGLRLLQSTLIDALRRGAHIRLLTGDYLNITQSAALRRLLDWQQQTRAFQEVMGLDPGLEEEPLRGRLAIRVIETEQTRRSFHPKSWQFEGLDFGVAFVGSSNFSYAALRTGVEWNLRVDRFRQPAVYAEVTAAFRSLWDQGRPIDVEWVEAYEIRAQQASQDLPPGEIETVEEEQPKPNEMQQEALVALSRARADGRGRALVVMATGLGKTFLAGFDVLAWAQGAGRAPRVLFVAHRRELLRQAAYTFRRLLPSATFGWFVGAEAELDGQVIFASVQKLSRPEHLSRIPGDWFDYVIIDEVHHAAAPSYRRLLRALAPGFLLGLTATPERADEADIVRLFDDYTAYRAGLGEGIARKLLVPFHYVGLTDTIDYAPLPWRNGRFDPDALSEAVSSQRRMERLWEAWRQHPGKRTLLFCASIAHANFVRDWLLNQRVRVAAVHSGPDSFDRAAALEALEDGLLEAVCAVDLFNEGIDVRSIDRIIMLRPTESVIIFLQQLGRGLRTAPEKFRLEVIDFVGNHRVFLDRLRGLLGAGERPVGLQDFLSDPASANRALPGGCQIALEDAALDALQQLLPKGDGDEVVRFYRELRAARGVRPQAGSLLRLGLRPSAMRARYGGWLHFLEAEGDLTSAEQRALATGRRWLEIVETTRMNKSFKLVLLDVLIQAEALVTGMPLTELAARCHAAYLRSPALFRDLTDTQRLTDPRNPAPGRWMSYWRDRALRDWTGGSGQSWFVIEGGWLLPRLPLPDDDADAQAALVSLTGELVDWRLTRYRRQRATQRGQEPAFIARVRWIPGASPRLVVPARRALRGELIARLPDGQPWRLQFERDAIAARPLLEGNNQLPELLTQWFGSLAGDPRYVHRVRFSPASDGWWLHPLGGQAPAFRVRKEVRQAPLSAMPSPTAAYGTEEEAVVVLPAPEGPTLIAARAVDDEMNGGSEPIRQGDWLLLRPGRRPLSAMHGQVAIVTSGDGTPRLRRVVRTGERFTLRADRPGGVREPAASNAAVVATLVSVVRPETLAPHEGTRCADDVLARAFGVSSAPTVYGETIDGHRFFLIDTGDVLVRPDRLQGPDGAPGETGYVLSRARPEEDWRYDGVAHFIEGGWNFAGVHYAVWRALGDNRAPQRTLPRSWRQRAETLAARWARRDHQIHVGGAVRTIAGRTRRGSLRLERDGAPLLSVTLADLGWALRASGAATLAGAPFTTRFATAQRYLLGTPENKQRIEPMTWALALLERLPPGEE